jgi:hypothetical protein
MKKINHFYLSTTVAAVLCLGPLYGGDASAAAQNPCSEDIAKYCQNAKPGWSDIMECLEMHESELSDACKGFEARMGGARIEREEWVREKREFRQRCRGDVDKFCTDAVPRPGGIVKCLNDHRKELSEACRELISPANSEEKKVQ